MSEFDLHSSEGTSNRITSMEETVGTAQDRDSMQGLQSFPHTNYAFTSLSHRSGTLKSPFSRSTSLRFDSNNRVMFLRSSTSFCFIYEMLPKLNVI